MPYHADKSPYSIYATVELARFLFKIAETTIPCGNYDSGREKL